MKNLSVRYSAGDQLQEFAVIDRVKVLLQVNIIYLGTSPVQIFVDLPNRRVLTLPRSESITRVGKIRLKDRFQNQQKSRLHNAVPNGRYSQRSLTSIRFRNIHPTHWLWNIAPFLHLSLKFLKVVGEPFLLYLFEALSIYSCCSTVRFSLAIGFFQHLPTIGLIIQTVEPELRLRFSLLMQFPLKLPKPFRV